MNPHLYGTLACRTSPKRQAKSVRIGTTLHARHQAGPDPIPCMHASVSWGTTTLFPCCQLMNSSFFFAPKPRHPPFTTWGRCSIDSIPILTRTPPSAHQIPFLHMHPSSRNFNLAPCRAPLLFLCHKAIPSFPCTVALMKITTAWSICWEHHAKMVCMIDVVISAWRLAHGKPVFKILKFRSNCSINSYLHNFVRFFTLPKCLNISYLRTPYENIFYFMCFKFKLNFYQIYRFHNVFN